MLTASAKLLDPVIQVARHSQQDPDSLLASAGIDTERIAHTGARIPAELFTRLLLELAQRTGNPRLALRIGEATQPRMLGSVGFLMSTAPNLRQAYQLLNDYLPLLIEGVHLSLEQEAQQVTLVLDLADDNDRTLVEWLLACLHNWTRWLTGKQVPLVSVDLAFPEPSSPQSYEQFFAAEVCFNADRNRLRFAAQHLELSCLDANDEMQRLHQSFADQLLSASGRDGTLVAQIKSLIRNRLSSGQPIGRQQLATQLNLSLRTLQRKLDQQGTHFQALFDQTRKDLALQLIQRGDRSFGEIAFQLGFSGLSAFQKAFKRWTGLAPGSYRSAQRPITIVPAPSQPRALSDLIGTTGITEERFYPLAQQLLQLISDWRQHDRKRPLLSPHRIGIDNNGLDSNSEQDYRLTLVDPEPLNGAGLLERLRYEAPEVSLALPYAVDERAELYQLGCLFYCLLHGQPPYIHTDPGELLQAHLQQTPAFDPQLSTVLTQILNKLLAIAAEERYQSLVGLQLDLKQSQLADQQHQPQALFEPGSRDAPTQIISAEHHTGREQQQQALQQALQDIHSSGRLVLIEGGSGSGKSSLVECLRRPLFRAQGALLSARFGPQAGDDLEIIIELARQRLRHKLALSSARRDLWSQRLQRQLGIHAALLQPLLPELNALLPPPEPLTLSHRERRPLLLEALAKLFRANRDPLVLFLDDLHHASSDALALLQRLLEPLEQQPLLLIISHDPAHTPTASPWALALPGIRYHRLCSQLTLNALPRNAIQQLVQKLFQQLTPELTALSDWLFQRSAGHPATLAQELEQLRQQHGICYQAAPPRWLWQPQQLPPALDQDLQQLLYAALTELPPATYELMQWAAILGDPFELELLAEIRQDPLARMTIHLWPAQQAGLVQQVGNETLAFSHPALRSELLRQLDDSDRAPIHWLLGDTLYQRWQSRPQSSPPPESAPQPASAAPLLQRCISQFNQGYQRAPQPQRRQRLITLNLEAARQAQQQGNLRLARSGYQQAFALLQPAGLKTPLGSTVIIEGAELARRCGDLACAEQWLAKLQGDSEAAAKHSTSAPLAVAISRLQLQLQPQQHQDQDQDQQPQTAIQPLRVALAARGIDIPQHSSQLADSLQRLLSGAHSIAAADEHREALLKQLLRVAEAQLDPLLYQSTATLLARYGNDPILHKRLLAALRLELLAQPDSAQTLPEIDLHQASDSAPLSMQQQTDHLEALLIQATRITPWLSPLPLSHVQLDHLRTQARQLGQLEMVGRCTLALFNGRWFSNETLPQLRIELEAEQASLDLSLSSERHALACSATLLVQQLTQPSTNSLVAGISDQLSPWALLAQCALNYLLDRRAHWPGLLAQVEQAQTRLSGLYAQTQLLLFSSLMEAELAAQSGQPDPRTLYKLQRNQALMQHWARLNPAGFSAQAALLDAELKQLSGQPCEAIFEHALHACEAADCLVLSALTFARFARYYRHRGLLTQARLLQDEAQRHYQRWGARALLTEHHP